MGCRRGVIGSSFETLAPLAPQDEVFAFGAWSALMLKNSLGLRAGLLSLLIFAGIVGIWQIATLPTAGSGPVMDPEYAKLVGAAAATGTISRAH